MSLKIALTTLGCKVNQFETAAMREQLLKRGFTAVAFKQAADVYIINTCTVTSKGDMQSRQLIRQAIRRNKAAYIVVTGCYAQTNYRQIQQIQGVDLILGNAEKANIEHYLTDLEKNSPAKTFVGTSVCNRQQSQIGAFLDHTRAFVKIQDGCNQACSYCIVPHARGKSRSQPPELVKEQVKRLIGSGYKEIVFSGINIGVYGQDLSPEISLAGLLRELIQLDGLGRIRLSSIEPTEFSSELIEVLQSDKICPHLHIPLQSAHEEQLKSMNRHYSAAQYQKLVEKLIDNIPHLALGTDVMVGFPGETADIFQHNYRIIEQFPLTYMHVFRYSPRPQTKAADFTDQINDTLKKERSRILRNLSQQKSLQYQQRYLGEVRPGLILNKSDAKTGWLSGLTDNYLKVSVPADKQLTGKIVALHISGIENNRLLGKLVV